MIFSPLSRSSAVMNDEHPEPFRAALPVRLKLADHLRLRLSSKCSKLRLIVRIRRDPSADRHDRLVAQSLRDELLSALGRAE